MPDSRPSIKLDFTSGLDQLPPRPKVDASTTHASVKAGRELGFSGRAESSRDEKAALQDNKLDGRRLRSRGANTQLNLKVTAQEKEMILRDASKLIQDPASSVSNIGEFVVQAVEFYRKHHDR